MKDVWRLPAIAKWEKTCGSHPTQKPLSLLTRIILASTEKGSWILDPFTGSSTTGIAANLIERKFLGIDNGLEYLEISKARKKEIESIDITQKYKSKIQGFHDDNELELFLIKEPQAEYPANEIKGITSRCT